MNKITNLQQKLRNYILRDLSLLKEGQALAKETEIAEKYFVGRNTVRKVMKTLENECLILRIRGKGTFPVTNEVSCHENRNPFRKIKIIFGLGLGLGGLEYYNQILVSVINKAQRENYHIEVANIYPVKNKYDFCLDTLKDPYVKGILLVAVTQKKITKALYQSGIPLCLLDHYTDLPIDVVDIASYKASYNTTKKLIELGHKRIFYVNSKPKTLCPERLHGYVDCLKDHDIPFHPSWVSEYPAYDQGGLQAAEMIVKLPKNKRPTAIYIFSTSMMIPFIDFVKSKGLRIPSDLSIYSNGDNPSPTNDQNYQNLCYNYFDGTKIGTRGLDLLLKRIQDPARPSKRIEVKANLLIGNSIGPNTLKQPLNK
ncbi:MAG: hypothetical protein COA79_11930 [Planctomycetota bacterium]|nr:MAG: hypothetical protein COA79_11930 [Planctomycetota bacterium]